MTNNDSVTGDRPKNDWGVAAFDRSPKTTQLLAENLSISFEIRRTFVADNNTSLGRFSLSYRELQIYGAKVKS